MKQTGLGVVVDNQAPRKQRLIIIVSPRPDGRRPADVNVPAREHGVAVLQQQASLESSVLGWEGGDGGKPGLTNSSLDSEGHLPWAKSWQMAEKLTRRVLGSVPRPSLR